MTRALRHVDAGRAEEVFAALRDALAGGPAVLPREAASDVRTGRSRTGAEESGTEETGTAETVARNVALVIETSGSTGVPKRVALSADALLASAAASAGAMGGQGQWVLALPAHYVAGAQVLVRSIAAETEPLVYGSGHFDAQRFSALADDLTHDLRYTSLVPVQLARLIDAVDAGSREVARSLRRFDGILVGGQALTPELRERAETVGARILSTYGSSETAGGCVYDGVPIGTTTVRSVGGLLEIAGPTLAEGYLGDDGRTRTAFHDADGRRWYRTGDLGRVDDGRVTVFGRADNVIISGGEKVLLDAVEQVVRGIPGLEAAIVVASDDDEWGQVPVVVVARGDRVGDPGGDRTGSALRELRATVADRVGRAAAPARIVEVGSLPTVSSGKPDRVTAARMAATTSGDEA